MIRAVNAKLWIGKAMTQIFVSAGEDIHCYVISIGMMDGFCYLKYIRRCNERTTVSHLLEQRFMYPVSGRSILGTEKTNIKNSIHLESLFLSFYFHYHCLTRSSLPQGDWKQTDGSSYTNYTRRKKTGHRRVLLARKLSLVGCRGLIQRTKNSYVSPHRPPHVSLYFLSYRSIKGTAWPLRPYNETAHDFLSFCFQFTLTNSTGICPDPQG